MEFTIALLITLMSMGLISQDQLDQISQKIAAGNGHDENGGGKIFIGPGNGDFHKVICPVCYKRGNGQGQGGEDKKYVHIGGQFDTVDAVH